MEVNNIYENPPQPFEDHSNEMIEVSSAIPNVKTNKMDNSCSGSVLYLFCLLFLGTQLRSPRLALHTFLRGLLHPALVPQLSNFLCILLTAFFSGCFNRLCKLISRKKFLPVIFFAVSADSADCSTRCSFNLVSLGCFVRGINSSRAAL